MNTIRGKTYRGHWWRIWMLVVAALAITLSGCDTDPEMDYAEVDEDGQPSPGNYAQEIMVGDDIEVTDISMGRGLEDHKEITEETRRFYPDDTVFVVVKMRGSTDDLWVRGTWYHGQELVTKTIHRVSPDGIEARSMHFGEDPDPLPVGDYIVEIRLNETVVDSLPFKVVPGDD